MYWKSLGMQLCKRKNLETNPLKCRVILWVISFLLIFFYLKIFHSTKNFHSTEKYIHSDSECHTCFVCHLFQALVSSQAWNTGWAPLCPLACAYVWVIPNCPHPALQTQHLQWNSLSHREANWAVWDETYTRGLINPLHEPIGLQQRRQKRRWDLPVEVTECFWIQGCSERP